jgi:hypothetical protein
MYVNLPLGPHYWRYQDQLLKETSQFGINSTSPKQIYPCVQVVGLVAVQQARCHVALTSLLLRPTVPPSRSSSGQVSRRNVRVSLVV